MAQLWTTGPALIYSTAGQNITYNSLGNGTITFAGTPIFVGTAETKPRISIRRAMKEVQNDLGGEKPIDLLYVGQDGIITADLNRFTFSQYLTMANAALAGGAVGGAGAAVPNGGAGADLNGATGTLLLTENQMFALIIVFPYAAKGAYQNVANGGPLWPCYVFPATTLEGPDDLDIGMQPFKVHAVWHAIRAFYPGGTPFGTGNFQLYYSASVSSLSLPAPT